MNISKEFLSFMGSQDAAGGVPQTSTLEESSGGGLEVDNNVLDFIAEPEGSSSSGTNKKQLDYQAEAKRLLKPLVFTESSGVHRETDGTLRVSEKGAQGLTQLMPATYKKPGYGIQPLRNDSPEEFLRFGEDYLAAMIRVFDDVEQGVAAYNAGPGKIHRAISKAARTGRDWKEFIPKETQEYIKKVK